MAKQKPAVRHRLEIVDVRVLRIQILDEVPGRHRLAGDFLAELLRRARPAGAVDVLVEPRLNGARARRCGSGSPCRACPFFSRETNCSPVDVAQSVGREVPDRAARPVDVLQDSVRVRCSGRYRAGPATVRARPPADRPPSVPCRSASARARTGGMMCRLYVTSSASTRMSEGSTRFTAL